jgi:hypothetical protein
VPIPVPDYYKEQEAELNTITNRINRLVKGLKLRGVYDSTLTELSELMKGEDNDLIAAQNVTELLERGGLEKAIWFMPIEMAAKVLRELYAQREQVKQIIYEITGISDIMRGATEASETATAQQIKANFGSLRVRRMQAEVARYVRDILRIKAEIIAERFQPETLAAMTGLQYPTAAQKQQLQMAAQQAQATGQQPPQVDPELMNAPTWEEIIACLRNDAMRTFKVDIETDSTVAASLESDMSGMKEVLTAVVQVIQGFGPAVQAQAIPVEAVKEIILAVVRRARLGNAVEDALDKMQQPAPPPQQHDNTAQIEQMKAQFKAQADQAAQEARAHADQAIQAARAETDKQIEQIRVAADERIEATRAAFEGREKERDRQLEVVLAFIKKQEAIEVAEIGAAATESAAQRSAAKDGGSNASV